MNNPIDKFSLRVALDHICSVYDTTLEEISDRTGYSLEFIEAMSLEGSFSDKQYRIEVMEFMKNLSQKYEIALDAAMAAGVLKFNDISSEIGSLILRVAKGLKEYQEDDEEE